jgi:hypothetical protein
VCKVRSNDL